MSICATHFPPQIPRLVLELFKRSCCHRIPFLPSLSPSPPSSLKFPFFPQSQSTCLEMAAAFLGTKLCAAFSGCGLGQVGVLGPEEGAAGIGSESLPTQPGFNSCPARPGGHPGLSCGCPAAPLGLPLSRPSAIWAQAPTRSVGLSLGVWPGARYWGEACPALGMPVSPGWRQLQL